MDISALAASHEVKGVEADLDIDFRLEDEDDENMEKISKKSKQKVQHVVKKSNRSRQATKERAVSEFYEEKSAHDLVRDRERKKLAKKKVVLQRQIEQKFAKEFNKFSTDSLEKTNAKDSEFKDKVMLQRQKTKKSSLPLKKDMLPVENTKHVMDHIVANTKRVEKEVKVKEKEQLSVLSKLKTNAKLHSRLQDYVSAYSTDLLKQTPQKKAKIIQLQKELQQTGVSTKEMRQIEKNVQKIISKDLKKQLKRSFTDVALSFKGKANVEVFNNYTKYYQVLNAARESNLFNSDDPHLNSVKSEIRSELLPFIANELDRTLVQTKLQTNSIKELIDAFEKYNSLSSFSKFDINSYMKKLSKKIQDEGLEQFIEPVKKGPVDTDQPDFTEQESSNQSDFNPEDVLDEDDGMGCFDTKDLRNLYIQQFFNHPPIKMLKLKVAIKKKESQWHPNRFQQLEKLRQEAKRIALLRLKLNLRSLLELRAALDDLSCPSYKTIKQEIRQTLKSMKKCGYVMTPLELKGLRDQCNRALFSIIKDEYGKILVYLESSPSNGALKDRKNKIESILVRLKKETNINEDLKPSCLNQLQFLSDVNIVEAA